MLNLSLATERIRIEPLITDDANELSAYRSDPEVARWQGWTAPYSVDQAHEFIASMTDTEVGPPGTRANLAIRHNADLIGDVYVHVVADMPHVVELGITLARASQGHGFATEVITALLSNLFETADDRGRRLITKAMAYVDTRNSASLALFDRLQFQREGLLRQTIRENDNEFGDEVLFGLTASDYRH